jgi:integrase
MGGERKRPESTEKGIKAVSGTSIQITFTYRGVCCRERIRLVPTPANLERANRHRIAILDAIERGTFDYATTFPDSPRRFQFAEEKGACHLLEDWLESWLAQQQKHLKSSTFDGYRKIIYGVLVKHIGRLRLDEIRVGHIKAMCDAMGQVTNKRLTNIQSVLRMALTDAVTDELIASNPLSGWNYTRREAPKPEDEIDPFTATEQEAILAACRDHHHNNLFQFAFWSGLRTSELVALEWGDIDWQRGTIRVERSVTTASKTQPELPKTRRSRREVKILPPAMEALKRQKTLTFLEGGRVFRNPNTGMPWIGDQKIRMAWESILKRAGIRYRSPKQTRHTYASMMLTAGESPIWIANQMGHSDTTMIFRRYGRWITDAVPEAGDKAVMLFAKNAAKKLHFAHETT